MTTKSNITEAISFLKDWRKAGPWVLTAILPDRKGIETQTFKASETKQLRAWIKKQNLDRNVYYHVNPTLRPLSSKAALTDMASVDWLHVDVDPRAGDDLDSERARILAVLQECKDLPAPTCIVFSGGGYQAYWRLAKPIELDGTKEKADAAGRYNLQIEMLLGGDSCHNVDRIMRLPGTINWPDKKKRKRGQKPIMAERILWEPEKRIYDLSKFTAAPMVQSSAGVGDAPSVNVSGNVRRINDLETELPAATASNAMGKCKVAINLGVDPEDPLRGDNSRSEWLFFVCCELVRNEVEDDVIYAIITDPDFGISASVLDKGNSESVHRYAIRQIQRAKEHDIEPWLAKLNSEYALIESVGGKCRIAKEVYSPALEQHEVDFLLIDGFKTTYSNKFVDVNTPTTKGGFMVVSVPVGKWWLSHPQRRTYSDVIFYPNHNFDGSLNLWRGFACDAQPGDCSLFLRHIEKNLCKNVQENYHYMLGWMALAVQLPHLPAEVAIVMRGRQGTGKGVFAHTFGSLFGTHYKHITNAKHLLGNFNSQLQDAVLVFADEAFNTQSLQHESALKALITESTIMVELKGVDVVSMRNCTHNIIAGNEDWLVPARLDDRRFFIVEVDDEHRRDTKYFSTMIKQMDKGGREALLHYLLNYDLSEFDVRMPPKTEELRRQQDHSMSDMEAFLYHRLQDGRMLPDRAVWQTEVVKDEVFDSFIAETNTRLSLQQVKSRLGKFFHSLLPITSYQLRGQTVEWTSTRGVIHRTQSPHMWKFPLLKKAREAWDKKYGKRKWNKIEIEIEAEPVDDPNYF